MPVHQYERWVDLHLASNTPFGVLNHTTPFSLSDIAKTPIVGIGAVAVRSYS